MTRFFRLLAVALGLAAAAPAHAIFHLWQLDELYSNADGTIQFVELVALAGGQQFLSGHNLTSTGASTRTFVFPADLPGDTTNKRMLIATQGFAALNVVTPDYVVPNGFFFQGGGQVNFAGVDLWQHGALPADNRSINRAGTPQTPTPTNFNGGTGVITLPSPPGINVDGLWYRGEVESGWGVNIAQQGEILFVTWFTYDADNSQMWLVGSDVRRISGNTYAGTLFRTTGPAFSAVPFSPNGVTLTNVGSVQFTFTDANNGVMSYVVNGVSQSKPIVRQVFSTLPTCTAGGAQGSTLNFQKIWYNAPAESEAGWGVNVTHQGDILFITWFTYDANGRGMWIVGSRFDRTSGNTFTGALFRTTGPAFNAVPWNPANLVLTQVGVGTLSFTSATSGTFNYTVNGVTQVKNIVPQSFGAPATVCRP